MCTISERTTMPGRGGARPNSGPKPSWRLGKTKAIRVPIAIADPLLALARRVDREETLNVPNLEFGTDTHFLSPDEMGKSSKPCKFSSA